MVGGGGSSKTDMGEWWTCMMGPRADLASALLHGHPSVTLFTPWVSKLTVSVASTDPWHRVHSQG